MYALLETYAYIPKFIAWLSSGAEGSIVHNLISCYFKWLTGLVLIKWQTRVSKMQQAHIRDAMLVSKHDPVCY